MSSAAVFRANPTNVELRRAGAKSANESKSVEVVQAAQKALAASSNIGIRRLLCEYHEGVLVLRGIVFSYYQKQMAQETVRKISGVEAILNSVIVNDSASRAVRNDN